MRRIAAGVVAVGLAMLALWLLRRPEGGSALEGSGPGALHAASGRWAEGATARAPTRTGAGPATSHSPRPTPNPDAPDSSAGSPRTPDDRVRGIVIDALTAVPLAGATVRLYARQSLTVQEVYARFRGRVAPTSHDGYPTSLDTMLDIEPQRSDGWRGGGEPVLVRDAGASAVPLSQAVTDATGGFDLPRPEGGSLAVVSREGYAALVSRLRDHPGGGLQARELVTGGSLRVPLWRAHIVSGRLVHQGGPPGVPLALELRGTALRPAEGEGDFESDDVGPYALAVGPSGTFRIEVGGSILPEVGATSFRVTITTPGWVAALDASVEVGAPPAKIEVLRVPVFRVRDAVSGAPIETFRLLIHELAGFSQAFPHRGGWYHVPDGVLPLLDHGGTDAYRQGKTFRFTVWAEGYDLATRDVPNPFVVGAGDIELALARGGPPRVEGVVLRAGHPVPDAAVALFDIGRTLVWRTGRLAEIAAVPTDVRGAFTIAGPPGEHRLRIAIGGSEHWLPVTLPADGPLRVELADFGSVSVHLIDADGRAVPAVSISLRDATRRQWHAETGEEGRVRFAPVPPGPIQILVVRKNQSGSVRAIGLADPVELVLTPGESREVPITAKRDEPPPPARLRVNGVPPGPGWQARRFGDHWTDVGPDGTLAIDPRGTVEISGPTDQRWRFDVVTDDAARAGAILEIASGGPGYSGILLDRTTGEPLPGVRVWASSGDRARPKLGALTDEEGRFVLDGLPAAPHTLAFEDTLATGVATAQRARYETVHFFAPPPSAGGAPLTLRLAFAEDSEWGPTRTLSGRLTDAMSGAPLARVRVLPVAVFDESGGALHVRAGDTEADAEGRYRVAVPVSAHYRLTLWPPVGESGTDRRWASLDVEVPADTSAAVRDLAVTWQRPAGR